MTFIKGRAKTGGIQKGQVWGKTKDWNEVSENFKGRYLERMIHILDNADDEQFIRHFKDLLEYFAPKMLRTDIKKETQTIVLDLSKLSNSQLDMLAGE